MSGTTVLMVVVERVGMSRGDKHAYPPTMSTWYPA